MKASVRTVKEKKNGKVYTSYRVRWSDAKGIARHKRFNDLGEARTFAALRQVEALNAEVLHAPRMTTLTDEQLRDAEAAFAVMDGLATLATAAESYRATHALAALTIERAVDLYLDAKESEGVRPRTLQGLRHLSRLFVAHVTPTRKVATLSASDCQAWIMAGAAPKSKRERHFALSGLFNWVLRQRTNTGARYLSESPVASLRPVKLPVKGNPDFLSPAEVERFLRAAEAHDRGRWVPYVVLATFCALRPSEIADLSAGAGWDAFKGDGRRLSVASHKVTQRRLMAVPENAQRWLAPYRAAGSPIVPVTRINENIAAIRDAAKIAHWVRDILRHTGITYRLAYGNTTAEVADWAGNSARIIKDAYDGQAEPEDAQRFYAILPADAGGKVVNFKKAAEQ